MNKHNLILIKNFIFILTLCIPTIVAGVVLSSSNASADPVSSSASAVVTVGSACTLTSTEDTAHEAEIPAGTSKTNIGSTTLTTICNDDEGFSIYAVGYSNDEYGNTMMLGSNSDFNTGLLSDTTYSSWSMKLAQSTTGTYATTIDNGYDDYNIIPESYIAVAHRNSGTGSASANPGTGSSITLTYGAHISGTQDTGAYVGKVKFTMVHPIDKEPGDAPIRCDPNAICYSPNANDVEGTMGEQTQNYNGEIMSPITVGEPVTLVPSNYKREGYGFAGWSKDQDAINNSSATIYGPQETIIAPGQISDSGLPLYAVWVPSAGYLQDFTASNCSSLSNGTVTALTDKRDGETYAVAKLADNKCWMIENLRLEAENTVGYNRFDSTITNESLAQGYGHGSGNPYSSPFIGLAEDDNFNYPNCNSLYYYNNGGMYPCSSPSIDIGSNNYPEMRMPNYNNYNTKEGLYDEVYSVDQPIYSYGNYYSWAAAIASTYPYTNEQPSPIGTSICPSGWALPDGGTINQASKEYYALGVSIDTDPFSSTNCDTVGKCWDDSISAGAGTKASRLMRAYPNNFLLSGNYNEGAPNYGTSGSYWAANSEYNSGTNTFAFRFYLSNSRVFPGTYTQEKHRGFSVRCVLR